MNMLRIAGLCLAAALVCATIRSVHPQLATIAALACGAGVMLLSLEDLGSFSDALRRLEGAINAGGGQIGLLKICGIALVAEFAADICRDAGEAALAKRIDLGVRLGVVAASLPAAARLMDCVLELMP